MTKHRDDPWPAADDARGRELPDDRLAARLRADAAGYAPRPDLRARVLARLDQAPAERALVAHAGGRRQALVAGLAVGLAAAAAVVAMVVLAPRRGEAPAPVSARTARFVAGAPLELPALFGDRAQRLEQAIDEPLREELLALASDAGRATDEFVRRLPVPRRFVAPR